MGIAAPDVSVLVLRPILDALRCADIDLPTLLRRARIRLDVCDDPSARISVDCLCELWKAAPIAARDEALGLRAAAHVQAGSFDVIGYIAKSSSTGRDALRRSQRYASLTAGHYSADVSFERDRAVIRHSYAYPVPRLISDFALAICARLGREFYGPTFPLLEVRISYPTPSDAHKYTETFGVPVRVGCGYNAIVLPASLLDTQHKDADERLCTILERQADADLKQWLSTQSFTTHVRRALAEQLEIGEVSVTLSAKKLAVSTSTLRRRLQQEGTRHAELLDELRHRLALLYLRQGLSSADVAERLGFAHASAFVKAFGRWTVTSCAAWRDAHV